MAEPDIRTGATPQAPTVGFIGLGRMGLPLASHLARNGVTLVVHDVRRAPMDALAALGATVGADAADVARRCDVVFTMLPGPAQVGQVVMGPDGVLAHLRPGGLHVELSTIDTDTVDAEAAMARGRGLRFADAPVGRLAAHADKGQSLFMLGADDADVEALEPLLLRMGTTVLRCGAPGAGTRMKLVNNLMVLCYCQLNSEALVLARAMGLDTRRTFDTLTGTTATNGQLKEKWPVKVLAGDLSPGFDIALGYKDLMLACQAAESAGVSLPMGNLARSLFRMARHAGLDGQDTSSMTEFWAASNGLPPIRL